MPLKNESRVEDGFAAALRQAPGAVPDFLDSYCQGDDTLRREIEDLLHHHRSAGEFLDTPVLELDSVREAFAEPSGITSRSVGAYRVDEEIGRGGMAVVYRGQRADGTFEKQVAIKILDRLYSISSDEARFQQERRMLGQLDTPYIVKIIDAGASEDGLAYFVMEYIDGSHIDVYCRERKLSVRERLELFLKVCDAVSTAHNSGIVHRDLKPSNILVDRQGSPKLIDFGIAKPLDMKGHPALTLPGLEVMTLLYASPERLDGDHDLANLASSDVYSLGVILFELLTGKKPIEPPPTLSPVDVPRFLRETEPTRPSKYDPALAGDIDRIALRAVDKDRTRRFASVEQLASHIRLYLDNRPLPGQGGDLLYTGKKFFRRNRAPILVATAIMAVLVGGIVATAREARIAQQRFDDVRKLATSFLFDFDAAIANVTGTTAARKLVVAKATEYLDKLAGENPNNDSLQAEIATAYERLATIQGNVFYSNLGQYQEATKSYEKALAIRQKLAAKHPSNTVFRRDLGNSYIQFADGLYTSNTKAGIARHREGLAILEPLAQAGDHSRAVETGRQRAYTRLCNVLLAVGDHSGALENCGKAVEASKALLALNPTDPAQRLALAVAYGQSANALRIDKRPKEAVPLLETAVSEFAKLHSDEPSNNGYARNLAGAYTLLGNTWTALGDTDKAIQCFEKGITTVRDMVRVDPVDARAKTTLAVSLMRLAPALVKSGRPAEGIASGKEGLEMFKSFADRPQATADDLNNYASFLMDVGVPALRDPRTALVYSKRAIGSAKTPGLVLLSTLADAYFANGNVHAAISTAERALAENPAPKDAGTAGVRADLERSLKRFKEQSEKSKT